MLTYEGDHQRGGEGKALGKHLVSQPEVKGGTNKIKSDKTDAAGRSTAVQAYPTERRRGKKGDKSDRSFHEARIHVLAPGEHAAILLASLPSGPPPFGTSALENVLGVLTASHHRGIGLLSATLTQVGDGLSVRNLKKYGILGGRLLKGSG